MSSITRTQLWDYAKTIYAARGNNEVTPWVAALADLDIHGGSPLYKSKYGNANLQKYSHFSEYINRHMTAMGSDKHIIPAPIHYYGDIATQLLDNDKATEFFASLPDWPELAYKSHNRRFANSDLNFYNPVALAMLYFLEYGEMVHPRDFEDYMRQHKIQCPIRLAVNVCQKPSKNSESYDRIILQLQK